MTLHKVNIQGFTFTEYLVSFQEQGVLDYLAKNASRNKLNEGY